MTNDYSDLIRRALAVVNPTKVGDYTVGDVGAALVTATGSVFVGVCIDAGSGMGFCAEHSAIAAMVTAGEFRIERIVAVWSGSEGACVLSPCGRCREFIRQMHPDNLQTEVVLDVDRAVPLVELLPYHDWFHPVRLTV
jgi:cytidine deaminase